MEIPVAGTLSAKGHMILRGYRAGAITRVRPYAQSLMHWQQQLPMFSGAQRERVVATMAVIKERIDCILEGYSLGIEAATDNLIMTGSLTGRDLFIQYLINGTTYSGGINYGALGTGSTTPAASDTQLAAEVARVGPSTALDISNNQAQFQFYFPDANLANGTYHEAGSFMNGTVSANTGKIFNRALLGSAYTKGAGTDTTLQINISLS